MKKLLIVGPGSVVYIKKREDLNYKESHIFLNRIDAISINGKAVSFCPVDVGDLVSYLGFKHDSTNLKWIIEEETGETFNLGVEFLLPDAADYRVMIPSVYNDSRMGNLFLVDIVNVNGEDILTNDSIQPEGIFTLEYDV